MVLKLYQNSAEPNKVDKTSNLNLIANISGDQVELDNNIRNPQFVVSSATTPTYNYAYVEAYRRYYYITDIIWAGQNLWRLVLRCDVLMSFKARILALSAMVSRQEHNYNNMLPDERQVITCNYEVSYIPNAGGEGIFTAQSAAGSNDRRYTVITSTSVEGA